MVLNDGFEQLVRSHSAALRRYLRRLVGLDAAEDLAQESFARTYGADLSGGRAPNVVLFHIARNLAINHRARMRIAARYRAGAAGDGCDQSLAPSLERTLAARQELELVLAAIEELPPRRREIVKLARLQGLSGKEIAMRLGIRRKSVEKQLGLAIAELTRYLQAAQAQEAAAVRSRKQRKPGSHHG